MLLRSGQLRVIAQTLVLILIAASLPLLFSESPASAGTTFQFNVLGNTNGHYGNNGGLNSSVWLVDMIENVYSLNPSAGFPWAVSTQEMCDASGVSNSQQYDYVAARLANDTSDGYTETFYQAKSPSVTNCTRKGNAIYARANSHTSIWNSDLNQSYANQQPPSSNDDLRGIACVFPTLYVLSWTACSTHLTLGSGAVAHNELAEAAGIFQYSAYTLGRNVLLGGDYNLTAYDSAVLGWYYGAPFQWTDEVDGTYPSLVGQPQFTCCMPTLGFGGVNPNKKIDYTWYARFTRLGGASVVDPPYDPPFALPKSDHRLLVGQIG